MIHLNYAVGRVCATVAAALLLAACGDEPPSSGAASEYTPAAQAGSEERTQADTGRDAGDTPAQAGRAPAGNIAGTAAGAVRDRVVEDPDPYLIGWIYHDWSGEDPGLDAVAEKRVPPPGSLFEGIAEKPKISNFIAAGLYYLSPEFVALVPSGKPIDMPELLNMGRKIGLTRHAVQHQRQHTLSRHFLQ